MSFFFECPFCNKEMQCEDECEDQIVTCPACGEEVVAERFQKKVSDDGIFRSMNRMSATDRLVSSRSRGGYIFLCLFFGSFGIHNFYIGAAAEGAIQLGLNMIATLFFLLGLFDGMPGGDNVCMIGFLLWIVLGTWCFVNLFRDVDGKNLKMQW